jgi:hypothetical protein
MSSDLLDLDSSRSATAAPRSVAAERAELPSLAPSRPRGRGEGEAERRRGTAKSSCCEKRLRRGFCLAISDSMAGRSANSTEHPTAPGRTRRVKAPGRSGRPLPPLVVQPDSALVWVVSRLPDST